MKLIRSLADLDKITLPRTCLTIGNFDGLHLGHLQVILQVKEIARRDNLASAIMTFEPHPAMFFNSENRDNFRIFTVSQKIAEISRWGIDYLIILPFNQKFSGLSAKNFIDILQNKLNLQHLVIGYDFTFGKNREGNFKSLENCQFGLTEISPLKSGQNSYFSGQTISSTLIRQAIARGKMEEAKEISGRNFQIWGRVINGQKLARKIGFPTINVMDRQKIVKPPFGVYKAKVFVPALQQKFLAALNFGIKPTIENPMNSEDSKFNQKIQPIYEAHLLGFNQEIYGQKVSIEIEKFIRPEQKFENLAKLQSQIKKDLDSLI